MTTIIETRCPCGLQCEANAVHNERGGYEQAAEDCRAYCKDGHRFGPAQAANVLVRAGAQFVEQALVDNPDGPVQMITDLSRTEVTYDVVIGDPSDSMSTKSARTIWRRTVVFGATDATVAGGRSFVEAARLQEHVAQAALELLESRRGA